MKTAHLVKVITQTVWVEVDSVTGNAEEKAYPIFRLDLSVPQRENGYERTAYGRDKKARLVPFPSFGNDLGHQARSHKEYPAEP